MNLEALRRHRFQALRTELTDRDTILYALTVGAGTRQRVEELGLTYEKALVTLPTMSAVLAEPRRWIINPAFDVNPLHSLHGEQRVQLYRPLPSAGTLRGEFRVRSVVDKGKDKGSLVHFEKTLYEAEDQSPLCTVTSTIFLRSDGGHGSFGEPPPPLPPTPHRSADVVDEVLVDSRAALFYRLNGDRNPLHIDPETARNAGFNKPLMHGLCTYGMCCYSLVRSVFDYDPAKITSIGSRFSAPVFPGDILRVEVWHVDGGVAFQAFAVGRNERVISNGFAAA